MNRATPLIVTWVQLMGFQALGLLMSVSTIALAAVAVPPAVWGTYGLLLSIVQVGYAVGLGWIGQSILRIGREEYAREGHIKATLSSAAPLALAFLAAIVAILWLAAPLASGFVALPYGTPLLIVAALASFTLFQMTSYAAQATGRLDGYTTGQLLYRLGPLLAVGAAWSGLGADPAHLLAGALGGWLVAGIATRRATRDSRIGIASISGEVVQSIWGYGRLLPIASTAAILVAWMDIWFIRAFIDAEAAGTYWWAYSVLTLGGAILIPLSAALAPRMIDLRLAESRAEIASRRELIVAGCLLAAVVAIAGSAPLKALSDLLLPVRYQPAGPLLAMLAASLPAQMAAYGASPLVLAFETMLPRVVALHVGAAALKSLANILLIPVMGVAGAALATGITIWAWALCLTAMIPAGRANEGRSLPSILVAALVGAILMGSAYAVSGFPPGTGFLTSSVVALSLWLVLKRAGLLSPLLGLEASLAALPLSRTTVRSALKHVAAPRC
jgi:O-antigen/teichoic acid export membrane protein